MNPPNLLIFSTSQINQYTITNALAYYQHYNLWGSRPMLMLVHNMCDKKCFFTAAFIHLINHWKLIIWLKYDMIIVFTALCRYTSFTSFYAGFLSLQYKEVWKGCGDWWYNTQKPLNMLLIKDIYIYYICKLVSTDKK